MRRARASLPLCAALVLAPCAAQASGELRAEGGRFLDAEGGVVVLRGVDVAGDAKVPPFMPASDPAIFDPLARFGMNAVRLLFTWEAYEPQPGAYDAAYLDYYASAAQAAWARGLYVVVDFHQDAFSRFSIDGCGDGFPKWALPPDVPPDTPDNSAKCASWGAKLLTNDAMKRAWESFYADEIGARTAYLAMVASVAERLASEPGVIGYDMLNEPVGDELTELGPLYEDAAVAIRAKSPDAILFVSPQAITSSGVQTKLAKPSFANAAYAPHYYDAGVLIFKNWTGTPPDDAFANMNGKAAEWGSPLFLGEFGAPAETNGVQGYVRALYDGLDRGFASGTQWVYTPGWTEAKKDGWNDEDLSIVDDQGRTRANFERRPFARRIAGTPVSMVVTPGAEASIEVAWAHDASVGETEIFVPRVDFFGSEALAITVEGEQLACMEDGELVRCESPVDGPAKVTVRGVKKAAAADPESSACGLVGLEMLVLWPLSWAARRRKGRT